MYGWPSPPPDRGSLFSRSVVGTGVKNSGGCSVKTVARHRRVNLSFKRGLRSNRVKNHVKKILELVALKPGKRTTVGSGVFLFTGQKITRTKKDLSKILSIPEIYQFNQHTHVDKFRH